jgi:hypothetical protein
MVINLIMVFLRYRILLLTILNQYWPYTLWESIEIENICCNLGESGQEIEETSPRPSTEVHRVKPSKEKSMP